MTLKEIFENENSNSGFIHLYKEGAFWKAYEVSAYLVWLRRGYKVFWKSTAGVPVGIHYVGFPESALLDEHDFGLCTFKSAKERVYMVNDNITNTDFMLWKERNKS